jgi:UDPglucose 6-dehydrogenase
MGLREAVMSLAPSSMVAEPPSPIGILGLWHLGSVTAACCAEHMSVVGFDPDASIVEGLTNGYPPIEEPGLTSLIEAAQAKERLRFTSDRAEFCRDLRLLWVTLDTPVDDEDNADVEFVIDEIRKCVSLMPADGLVLLSSQVPVGTCRHLESEFGGRGYRFAYAPENLRLGNAIEIFRHPDRLIVGCRDGETRRELERLLSVFNENIIWMTPESAEMTKHAINAFLALSISYMNEIAALCERSGADARDVERGLKSESRIGPKAYLSAGSAFAGGTLARDVVTCIGLSREFGEELSLLPAIKTSNDHHRDWPVRKLAQRISEPTGKRIALLGLTYKPGTNTMRRSAAIEWAEHLRSQGFSVAAYDPAVKALPPALGWLSLQPDVDTLLKDAEAVIVCTQWPEFRQRRDWAELVRSMARPLVLDPGGFLGEQLASDDGVEYLSVGSPR